MFNINTYRGMRDSRVLTESPAIEILSGFRTQSRMTHAILEARKYGKGYSIYDDVKHRQRTWSPNATFAGKRSAENLSSLSGLLYFDIDQLPEGESLEALKQRLFQHPSVFGVWLSFGGRGLGGVLRCDLANAKHIYYVTGRFANVMGITLDAKVRHIAAQSVFSYDPEILINENAVPFSYDPTEAETVARQKQQITKQAFQGNVPEANWWETRETDRIVFKTRLAPTEYTNEDYVLKPEGQPYCEVYIPKEGIREGQRNSRLITICNKLIANSPRAEKSDLETVMQTLN